MYKQSIAAFATLAWGMASTVALQHGDYYYNDGLAIRYQQLARDVFTGVPVHEWDDKIHQRSDEDWGLDDFVTRDANGTEAAEVEVRNTPGTCQTFASCAKTVGDKALSAVFYAWFTAAGKAANTSGKDITDFLNSSFVAGVSGVAIGGIINNKVTAATTPSSTECSTSHTASDMINSAVSNVLAKNPKATSIEVEVVGETTTWSINVSVGAAGTTPSPFCG
ncbi:hypothetical protein SCUP234_03992 [Seiridium cupressi]